MTAPVLRRQCFARIPRSCSRVRFPPAIATIRSHTHLAAAPTTTDTLHAGFSYSGPLEQVGQNPTDLNSAAEQRVTQTWQNQAPSEPREPVHVGPPPQTSRWDGQMKKFVPEAQKSKLKKLNPKGRKEHASLTARELKAKIFASDGVYDKIHLDLKERYALTNPELSQTISQLQRLLWGLPKEAAMANIDRFHLWKSDLSYHMSRIGTSLPPNDFHDSNIKEMVELVEKDSSLFEAFWHRLDLHRQELLFPQMVACAMSSHPPPLVALVRLTFNPVSCPNYILEDIVYFLSRYSEAMGQKRTPHKRNDATKVADFLSRHAPYRYTQLSQSSLRYIVLQNSLDKVWEHYQKSVERGQYWTHNTLLHLASRLAKSSGHKVQAMHVFSHMKSLENFDINSPEAASVCTSLLSVPRVGPLPDGLAEPDNMFKFLLNLGFNPNLISWSALMHNFCKRGHLDTGWKVFDMLCQQGFQPDAQALSILMNSSRTENDIQSARNVLRVAIASKSWSPGLINNFLATLFAASESQARIERRQRKSNNAWRSMVQLYSKFFHLAPLQQLTLFPLENILTLRDALWGRDTELTNMAASVRPLKDSELMQPDSNTLILMFTAHMRSIQNPFALRRYYRLYQRLQQQRNPLIMAMLRDHGTRIHDSFVQAFMQFRATVPFALEIALRMLRRGRQTLRDKSQRCRYQAPSAHTWTILMNGFKNHREATDAARILDLMIRVAAVQPTSATWNILLAAYARQGRLRAAVEVVSCREAAGFASGQRTVESFRFFSEQQRVRVIELLDAQRKKLAAAAAIQSFDDKQPTEGKLSSSEQHERILRFLKMVLPATEIAEITSEAKHFESLSDMQHAKLVIWRMQRKWAQLAEAQPKRRKMNYKHANFLWRQRQAAHQRLRTRRP
ncbi:leucine-rich PPR motif-containing protein [Microdochium nivale]|nr:leucine-rich PPR motif-containing protein [Microdochium nivale]